MSATRDELRQDLRDAMRRCLSLMTTDMIRTECDLIALDLEEYVQAEFKAHGLEMTGA
jgi:hypothetical protein